MNNHSALKSTFITFILLAFFLSLCGLLFIFSSSSLYAYEKCGTSYYFLKKQSLVLVLGLICFFIISCIPFSLVKKVVPYFFFGSLILVLGTIISPFTLKIHGSKRWLSLGALSGQPSELLKVFFFSYISLLLERNNHRLNQLKTYLPLLLFVIVHMLLLLKQPDFGGSITLFATSLALFFSIGIPIRYIFYTIFSSLPILSILVLIAPYRFNRILNFLNPWSDPQGRGYQIIQSLIAIGSGGFWGVGIAQSKQKFFYLPMQHTDFIFSIIAEEVGFIGCCFLIMVYATFSYYGFKLCNFFKHASFSYCMTLSFVTLISFQTLINMMVACGMLPTKGIGLPFISYGGSSLLSLFLMLGLITNCVRHELRTNAYKS